MSFFPYLWDFPTRESPTICAHEDEEYVPYFGIVKCHFCKQFICDALERVREDNPGVITIRFAGKDVFLERESGNMASIIGAF